MLYNHKSDALYRASAGSGDVPQGTSLGSQLPGFLVRKRETLRGPSDGAVESKGISSASSMPPAFEGRSYQPEKSPPRDQVVRKHNRLRASGGDCVIHARSLGVCRGLGTLYRAFARL